MATTILFDGLAIEAAQLHCDPPPSDASGPVVLQLTVEPGDIKPAGRATPIVFPFGSLLYRGDFRLLSQRHQPSAEVEYTFVSEGTVAQEPQRWQSTLAWILGRARRAPGSG